MKRKETRLEKNLLGIGYHLSHKTYTGKHSDKVDTYVYIKDNGVIEYSVFLNKDRTTIRNYSFRNKVYMDYTSGILDSLIEINSKFQNELMGIYDFSRNCAYEIPDIGFSSDPFIEESGFDD